jgi:hypothetical protein
VKRVVGLFSKKEPAGTIFKSYVQALIIQNINGTYTEEFSELLSLFYLGL